LLQQIGPRADRGGLDPADHRLQVLEGRAVVLVALGQPVRGARRAGFQRGVDPAVLVFQVMLAERQQTHEVAEQARQHVRVFTRTGAQTHQHLGLGKAQALVDRAVEIVGRHSLGAQERHNEKPPLSPARIADGPHGSM
jgi:hypothetical protein